MNAISLITLGLFFMGLAFAARAVFALLAVFPTNFAGRIITFILYLASSFAATGAAIAISAGEGPLGIDGLQWSVVFVCIQSVGQWVLILYLSYDHLRRWGSQSREDERQEHRD